MVLPRRTGFWTGLLTLATLLLACTQTPIDACVPCTAGVVIVTENIATDTVWDACVYVIKQVIFIERDVTLTIKPGVTVKLDDGMSLNLRGEQGSEAGAELTAAGTANHPIVFTSHHDDDAAGDTNGDGAATVPARGDWGHLGVQSGSTLELSHAEVRYGNDAIDGGSQSDYLLMLDRVDFEHNAGYAINTPLPHYSSSLTNNLFADNERPIHIDGAIDLGSSNTFMASNDQNGIFLAFFEGLAAKTTHSWEETDAPFVISQDPLLLVPHDHVLDIGAGVTVKLQAGRSLSLQGDAVSSGATLNANGTAANPVVFTSYLDDSAGGDTNGDGATTPAPGDWNQLRVNTRGTLNLNHVTIRYGNDAVAGEGNQYVVQIDDSDIGDNRGDGIDLLDATFSSSGRISNSSIHDNELFGIEFHASENRNNYLLDNNTFSANGSGDVNP